MHLHYRINKFEDTNKRFTWVAVAIGGTALIGGGVALYEGEQNRKEQEKAQDQSNAQPDYLQLPGYGESEAARGNWWQTLQDWGKSGSYGANTSNYDEIYNQAAKKINQYYWGGPSSPGMMDKVKAGAARRGVSESPAIDVLTQRTGVEEANQLGALSSEVNTQKANAIETSRQNWLSSLTNLSGLKPSYVSGKTGQFSAPTMNGLGPMITTAGSGVASYMQNKQDQDWYANLLNSMKETPTTTQGSITDTGGYGDIKIDNPYSGAWNS
jgi:hypothetical protein